MISARGFLSPFHQHGTNQERPLTDEQQRALIEFVRWIVEDWYVKDVCTTLPRKASQLGVCEYDANMKLRLSAWLQDKTTPDQG